MYTNCLISWVDDGSTELLIFKSTEDVDDKDDLIFYYGLSRQDLCKLADSGNPVDGEFYIIDVYDSFDTLV